jgi:hypothetical protein
LRLENDIICAEGAPEPKEPAVCTGGAPGGGLRNGHQYLEAAASIGRNSTGLRSALEGIRVTVRGEQPNLPAQMGQHPGGCRGVPQGEAQSIPATRPILRASIDDTGDAEGARERMGFPFTTKSGHIESSTLKKRRKSTRRRWRIGVPPFVAYDLRHTCLTRWAKSMHPFTLMKMFGHADLNTTMRSAPERSRLSRRDGKRAEQARWHRMGHNDQSEPLAPRQKKSAIN